MFSEQKKKVKQLKIECLEIFRIFLSMKKEKNYNKLVRVSNFWNNSYIDYESNSDRSKTLSVEEYLNKIRTYLKDIMNNPKKSNSWKIQLAIEINLISSINNDEECVMQ